MVTSVFVTTAFRAHAPKEAKRVVERAEHMAASPVNAEIIFPWARLGIFEELSFEPTPGPGDSEGGDVFAPAMAAPRVPRPAACSRMQRLSPPKGAIGAGRMFASCSRE